MKKHNRQRGRPPKQRYLDYDYERAFDTQASMLSESQIERALSRQEKAHKRGDAKPQR